jgi:2-dehydropantoate 2-reductase
LGVEDRFAEWFGSERVFGLLCFVGVNRDDDGTIRHITFGQVSVGHFMDNPVERELLRKLFEGAGIECECPRSLLEARWRKLGWNLPFNGLCVLYDCTTDGIVSDRERRAFALALAHETVTIGNRDLASRGSSAQIEEDWAELQVRRTDTMGAYAPSTLLDARAGRVLEYDTLFLEAARRARRLDCSAPALARLIDGLRARGIFDDDAKLR